MKFLNELVGFAVLTGPLWLILIVLGIAIWIGAKAAKRFERRSAKIAVRLLVFLLVFFAPFADEVAGTIYLNHLCATEAGVKVYKTVELSAEYWDEEGRPKFFNKQGYVDRDFWLMRIDEGGGHVERYSSIFAIDKNFSRVADKGSRELLGEIITFRHWGGWVRRNFSPSNTADSCQYIYDPNFSRDFYGRLFKPANSSK
jgi:hypothetical protein